MKKNQAVQAGGLLVWSAYLLRIYLTLNNMGLSVSLPVVAAKYGALEWYAVILVVGSTASTIVSSMAGSLNNLFGRRRMITLSVSGVILASAVCAFSQSLWVFIGGYFCVNLFFGLGSTMPVGILADSTDPVERPRFMTNYSVMNNLGNLIGPLLGGLVTDKLGFVYTPLYPVPLGIAAVILILKLYHPAKAAGCHPGFDFMGGGLIVGGIGSLIVFLNMGGKQAPWSSPLILGLAAMFVLCLVVFLRHGKRAENAVIPLKLFRIPSFAVANILIPLILPQYNLGANFTLLLVQAGMGQSAASSATYAIPKTLAIIFMAGLLGRWISHHSTWHKRFVLISGGLIGTTVFFMALTSTWSSFPLLLYLFMFMLGVGESMYYMTLYPMYQRDLPPALLPAGISAQFLLASLSLSITSTVYGMVISAMGGDIHLAFPVMCLITLIPVSLYLIIGALFLRPAQADDGNMQIIMPTLRLHGRWQKT